MKTIWTIGYESATVPALVSALQAAGVERVVDVRAVVSSRRPGFSKNKLAENLAAGGIGYLHLRGLGTPAEGRAAARAGKWDELRAIFTEHMDTLPARDDLDRLAELVRGGGKACLLCYEADPAHCHRSLVVEALREIEPVDSVDLFP